MYHMKSIVSIEDSTVLPKCMYHIKNKINSSEMGEMDINISDQGSPNKHISELEERQDKLLLKLDNLYEKIKTISSMCTDNIQQKNDIKSASRSHAKETKHNVLQEVVLTLNPDNLPWFLNIFLKSSVDINTVWHIHSTINSDKIPKIEAFLKRNESLYNSKTNEIVNLRLIFKSVSTAPELKLASLDIPIVGTVNILRFLCCNYSNVVPYNFNDHEVDSLLDLCFLLERALDKNKETLLNKIFSGSNTWIYGNKFTIVDLAVFNTIKQMQNCVKYVPKQWFRNCEEIFV